MFLFIMVLWISVCMDENWFRFVIDLGFIIVFDCCIKFLLNRWYNDYRWCERGYDIWNYLIRIFCNINNEVYIVGVYYLYGWLLLVVFC